MVVTGEMVYANLDDDLNNPNLVLIQGSEEIPFEPCTVSSPRRFDFDVTENVDVILEGKNSAFVKAPNLSVNTFRDWNVPGFNTLEIHLEKSRPALPNDLSPTDSRGKRLAAAEF